MTRLKSSNWLLEHSYDIHSQSGEDGIIEKILELIPDKDNWCVEFGAWDGIHLSNTRNLIENKAYSAILIEGDQEKFGEISKNYSSNSNVIPICGFVGFEATDNLDVLLLNLPIPDKFDFLSIDIDGNDYHVWKAITRYKPKVICIEFNQTIPTEVRFVQPADFSITQGSSLLSITELGEEKGYKLVSVSAWNAFFVRADYYPLFGIEDNSPATLRTNLDSVTHIFSGYDGTVFIRGSSKLPWHNIKLEEKKFQQLPKFLRIFPGNYQLIHKIFFKLFIFFLS
jgi:hypothetical protein